MRTEKPIDDLIEAGWRVVNSDFDETAFQNWRSKATICLESLLGEDHRSTKSFRDHVLQYDLTYYCSQRTKKTPKPCS
jgi:hypothetical protein